MVAAAQSFEHGTLTGYNRHRCRCEACVSRKRAWRHAYYVKNRATELARVSERYVKNRERILEERRAWGIGYRERVREHRRTHDRAAYAENPLPRLEAARAYHRRRVAIVQRLKRMKGCADCGLRGPSRNLHFHHRDPLAKRFVIATSINRSWISVKAEIAKCEVLCADCHRARHKTIGRRVA